MMLSPQQIRVLGALMEKENTTPDLYPLSLNALLAACNQRSSRDPVMDLTEDEVRLALHQLADAGLAGPARGSLHGSVGRVGKYEHHARTVLNLRRDETALLCLLLLRGAQTPGELRARAERLHTFDDLSSVVDTLERLAASPAEEIGGTGQAPAPLRPLVAMLARQPGSREARYCHLLGTDRERLETTAFVPGGAPSLGGPLVGSTPAASVSGSAARIAELEARVISLEQRIHALEMQLATTNGGLAARDPSPLEER